MIVFDGRYHAQKLEETISEAVKAGAAAPYVYLVIIQVGDNVASEKYINLKLKLCEKVGVRTKLIKIHTNLSDTEILLQIQQVIDSPETGGCIIQMPLPRLSLNSALDLIPLSKDLDMLSSKSMFQFTSGNYQKMPPVVRSVDYFLKTNGIDLQGKSATVVGYGQVVGKPVAHFLSSLGAKVNVLDNYKTGVPLTSDLLILSAGVPNLVNGEDISSGCAVIDFGSSIVEGKTVGDLNMHSALGHLSNISPSPGGMGPLVVRFLVMNFLGI
ncbi:bifunctional 5,10-methylenetetrahydrofolate dehydrogenase/5,10-methenyltetrahydrofolate cyclohydrolase [candidate division WWE3 bacterium]|uniref:Bifunctional 5,10-methylenetetrahydrofolate dehydrogenase/5,10-methenyltetrahydrofolate cyclohydrolase n=1 Tax=candidate division WWE3 bacterium TaxID=2053526 RepID=A0A7X9DJX0_UNCKA|nr:bifunctional 5,10-methylenetetrahydrofolate dehydrogenase/5,10-methenyltetrahydrofolate cyclohydrolase [candidate division WWE3 bacterium]